MSTIPVELREPEFISDPQMLPEEYKYHESVQNQDTDGNLLLAAGALGAAFFGYRWYMQRRLREQFKGKQPKSSELRESIKDTFTDYKAVMVRTILPHLISGYTDGLIDVSTGNIPDEVLYQVAYGYANRMGEHINDVSAEAVVTGYQSLLNRKVPPARAMERVLDAYGVPPRTMNTLVNLWTAEEPKIRSNIVPIDRKTAQARVTIEESLSNRARQIGDNEVWSAREQAKQVVWSYGVQTGDIPQEATKRWVTADDERVCPSCGPMHRKSVGVMEKFKIPGHGKVWAPPLHPNCRCDIKLNTPVPRKALRDVRHLQPVRKARYVRTPEGAAHYGQPMGSRIQADPQPQRQRQAAAQPQREVRTATRERTMDPLLENALRTPAQEESKLDLSLHSRLRSRSESKLGSSTGSKLGDVQQPASVLGEYASPAARLGDSATMEAANLGAARLRGSNLSSGILSTATLNNTKMASAQVIEGELIRAPETDVAGYQKLSKPMILLAPYFEIDVLEQDTIQTSDEAWVEVTSASSGHAEGLSHTEEVWRELADYWNDHAQMVDEEFFEGVEDGEYRYMDLPNGMRLAVDFEMWHAAYAEAVYGTRPEESETFAARARDPLRPDSGMAIEISAHRIAEYFGFHAQVEETMPTLAVSFYGNPDLMENPGRYSYATNPGHWRRSGDINTHTMRFDGVLPHRLVFLEPVEPDENVLSDWDDFSDFPEAEDFDIDE